MAKKSKQQQHQGRKRKQQLVTKDIDEDDLDRFAGSSDEESEVEEAQTIQQPADQEVQQANVGNDKGDSASSKSSEIEDETLPNFGVDEDDDDDDDSSIISDSIEKEEDPAMKMANVIGQILGGQDKKTKPTASVVLGKTVTPLQNCTENAI
jgi:hypothetical protein